MKRSWTLSALLVVVICAAPSLAWAQDGGPVDPKNEETRPGATPPVDSPFNFRLTPPEGINPDDNPSDPVPFPTFDPIDRGAPDAGPGADRERIESDDFGTDAGVVVDDRDPAAAGAPFRADGDPPPLPGNPLPSERSAIEKRGEEDARRTQTGEQKDPRLNLRLDAARCISKEELERATQAGKREAFGTSSIPLGPFFWASRDRTLVQVMLVYWRYLDVEERSRLEFMFPLYLETCSPQSDTFVGTFGLWGHRTDVLGTAGYIGPYLYRRDAFESSDVVFPVFWWLRGEREHTLIAGPWYDFERQGTRRFGLVPFYFGGTEKNGAFFDVTPVFAKWGDGYQRNFWALQTWGSFSPQHWSIASFPFYWGSETRSLVGGQDDARGENRVGDVDSYYHVIPPLLTFWSGEQTPSGPVSRLIVGAFGDFESPGGRDTTIFPLAIWGEGQAMPASARSNDYRTFGRAMWDIINDVTPFQLGPRENARFSYQLAPFFLHLEDTVETETKNGIERNHIERWAVGPGYFASTTEGGWDAGVFPLWFEGWESDDAARRRGAKTEDGGAPFHYRVVPPLLYAHFGTGDVASTFFAQTYLLRQGDAYDFGSVPFYFRGRAPDDDDTWYDHAPLALNFHWGRGGRGGRGGSGGNSGSAKSSAHIVGPGFSFESERGYDHGIFPFYFGGETSPGHQRPGALARFEDFLFDNREDELQVDDDDTRGLLDGSTERPTDHYRVIPPLLYAHFGDQRSETTIVAQSYFLRDDDGWDFGSIPFAFFGRDNDDDQGFYDVIPPLLFARWGDKNATQLIAGPWYDFRVDFFVGFPEYKSRHFGLAPLFFAGSFGPGAYDDNTNLEDRVLTEKETEVYVRYHTGPFFLHLGFDKVDVLLAAQTLALWGEDGWFALSIPFYLGFASDGTPLAGGGRTGADWFHLVPPLLTFVGGNDGARLPSGELDPTADEGAWSTWITGPLWYLETERGFDTSLLPFFAFGSVDGGPGGKNSFLASDAGRNGPHRSRPFFSNLATEVVYNIFGGDVQEALFGPPDRGFSYHLIPPLAYGHLATATHKRTFFLQSYLSRSDAGYDLGSFPFFFHGRTLPSGEASDSADDATAQSYYDVVPPLAFASWGGTDADGGWRERLLFLQTFYGREHYPASVRENGTVVDAADAWRFWSVPFAFFGNDDRQGEDHFYAVVPLLGFAHFGDSSTSNTVVGPYFDLRNKTGQDYGFAPFYLAGEGTGEGSPVTSFIGKNIWAEIWDDKTARWLFPEEGHHYRVIPPLLYAHLGGGDDELTVFGANYLRRSRTGWDAGAFPFVFAGATSDKSNDDFSYTIAPLLLSGFYQQTNNRFTIVGPWFDFHLDIDEEDEFRALGLIPFGGGYRFRKDYLYAGPAFAHWGDAQSDNWWVLQTFVTDERIDDDGTLLDPFGHRNSPAKWHASVERTRFYSVPFVFYEETRGAWIATGATGGEEHVDDDTASEQLSSTLLMPLLLTWSQRSQTDAHLVAGPYFDFENEHGRDFELMPLYFEGSSTGTGRSPLWRWARTLREDLWGLDDDTVEVTPGVFATSQNTADASGPSHYRIIPALAYLHFGDEAMHRTVFGPSWFFDDVDGWNAGVLPFYFGRRSKRYGEHDIVLPLLFARWKEAKRDAGGLWAGPLFAWHAPTYAEAMVLGLFYGGWMTPDAQGDVEEGPLTGFVRGLPFGDLLAGDKGDDGSWWIAPPFGAHRSHRDGSATLVLQSWWISERSASSASHHIGSAPFLFHGRTFDDDGETKSFYDIVPPALFGIWGEGDETNVYALQTWAKLSPTQWRVWSAPFYFGGVRQQQWALDDDSSGTPVAYHHLVPLLGTFFWGDDLAGQERAIIAPFLTLWLNNPTDSFLLVGPYTRYDDKKTGDFDQALWPVWFSGRQADRFYDLVLPFAGAWGDSAQQTRFLLTAFESTWANGDYTRAILPFYYSHKKFDKGVLSSSFDMITPAYFSWGDAQQQRSVFVPTLTYASHIGDEDFLIAPFVYHLENQAQTDTVVFPFYWHFRRAEAGVETFEALVASGVWWDFRWPNEDKRLQIAPGYMRFDSPDEEFHIAGPISWTKGKAENEAAWSFHVFPFFSMWSYHPGHFKWRALLFAAGYEREEGKGMPPREQWMFFGIKTDAE